MSGTPEGAAGPAAWHRQVAVAAFNRAWELIGQAGRSAGDDREMLATTFASRYHWEQAGGPEQWWAGEWQIAHVACLLGEGGLALRYAAAALDRVREQGWTGWQLASACEGMARAHAVAGDGPARDRFVALAREALDAEPDEEEREIIAAQLATVPPVR